MRMYCPRCKQEYEDKTVCPQCCIELRTTPKLTWGRTIPGELLKKWPYDDQGEPIRPAFLMHCTETDMEDRVVLSLLEAYGIPAVRTYTNDGEFGKVILGMSGTGVELYVPETMLEDAKNLLEEVPEDDL